MRPRKNGIDYFPLDVDMDQDDKIQCLLAEFGVEAFGILILLLMRIYRDGYFTKWRETERLLFTRRAGVELARLDSIVAGAVKWGFFDLRLLENYGILTSRGIQKRYQQATSKRKVTVISEAFDLTKAEIVSDAETLVSDAETLVSAPETISADLENPVNGVSAPETLVSAPETLVSDAESTQRIVQYSTEQNSTVQETRAREARPPSPGKDSKEQNKVSLSENSKESKKTKKDHLLWGKEEIKTEVMPFVFLGNEEREYLESKLEEGELEYWLKELSRRGEDYLKLVANGRSHFDLILDWRKKKLEEGKLWSSPDRHYLPRYQVKKEETPARPQPPLFKPETREEIAVNIPADVQAKLDQLVGRVNPAAAEEEHE